MMITLLIKLKLTQQVTFAEINIHVLIVHTIEYWNSHPKDEHCKHVAKLLKSELWSSKITRLLKKYLSTWKHYTILYNIPIYYMKTLHHIIQYTNILHENTTPYYTIYQYTTWKHYTVDSIYQYTTWKHYTVDSIYQYTTWKHYTVGSIYYYMKTLHHMYSIPIHMKTLHHIMTIYQYTTWKHYTILYNIPIYYMKTLHHIIQYTNILHENTTL